MIIIVIYHSIIFWNDWLEIVPVYPSEILKQISLWLNSLHIYAFVLVSRYLFYYLRSEKEKYDKFFPFVINKFKRLIVPYIFVSVIYVVPIYCLFFDNDIVTIFDKFGLGISPSQLWFLLMLFLLFMIFYPLSKFFAKHTFVGVVIVLVIYILGLVCGKFTPNIFNIWTACTYVPVFLVGFKLRQCGTNYIRKIPGLIWLILDVGLFVMVQYLAKYDSFMFKLLGLGFDFILHIIGAIMSFLVLQKLADKAKWQDSILFDFIAKQSMPIYLLHQQVIYFFIFWLNGLVNPYINASINFIGAMVVSIIISGTLMRFKLTRFLIGEK